jgi:hypothetical protein
MNALGFVEVAATTVLFRLPTAVEVRVMPLHALAPAQAGRDLAPLFRRAPRLRAFVTDLLRREVDPRGMCLLASQMACFSRIDDQAPQLLLALQRRVEFAGAPP